MTIYTAMLKPDAEPVLVKEGFSWGALFLGPFWLAAHRAWIAAAVVLAAEILGGLVPAPASGVAAIGFALIVGFAGNDLRRWTLENRGYALVHVVSARSSDDAFTRLMANRPDLGARFAPGLAAEAAR